MVPSNSILVLSFFILLLSSSSSFADNVAPAGSDQPDLNKFLDSLAGGSVTSLHETMQCMHKLVPCKPYLRNPATEPPPATCCEPLKEIVAGDAQCLCKFFNDPEVLDSMNITQENALKVPHACGFEADVSKCQKEEKASAPTTKPTITANDINAAADQVQSSADEKSDSTKNMIPYGITTLVVLMISSQLFSA